MQTINYLNLTNGLAYANKFENTKFIRIQSTLLEAKKFNKIIYELDYQFLIDLALGYNINVIDASVNKNESRALYQGIPWIEFVLNKYWLDKEITPFVRNHNCIEYFKHLYINNLKKCTLLKLKYTKKFLNQNVNEIKINRICYSIDKEKSVKELNEKIGF
jgi:hypothetical protein